MNSDKDQPDTHRGMFTSTEQLDSYEKLWHLCIYKPSRIELKEKVNVHVCACVHVHLQRMCVCVYWMLNGLLYTYVPLQFTQYSDLMQYSVFVDIRYFEMTVCIC